MNWFLNSTDVKYYQAIKDILTTQDFRQHNIFI